MNTIERKIIRQCLADLIDAGYTISVDNRSGSMADDDYLILRSRDLKAIMAVLGSMDEDVLHVSNPAASPSYSFVHLVYNGDETVICDHGVSLEPVLTRTTALAQRLAG